MTSRIGIFSLSVFFSIISTVSVFGQSQRSFDAQELKERKDEIRLEKQETLSVERAERLSGRCNAAQVKIDSIWNKVSNESGLYGQVYDAWKHNFDALVARLESSNVDIADLEADLQNLDVQIVEVKSVLAEYAAELENITSDDCTEDPQAFHDSLLVARELRQLAKDGMLSAKSFKSR